MAAIKRFTIWSLILKLGVSDGDELVKLIKSATGVTDLQNKINIRYHIPLRVSECQDLMEDAKWAHMSNRAMADKLATGDVIDLSGCERTVQGDYVMPAKFTVDQDFCDAKTEEWINSIGRHRETKKYFGSTSNKFYQNAMFECVWLR